MTIPTLAPTPVRGDPDTFSTAFETFLSGLDPWAVAVQAVGDAADADAIAAADSADTAATQAGLATTNGAAQVALAAAQVALATTQAELATTNGAAQVALAAAQVALATTQAGNAATSATAAANSALIAGATIWVSGTTYAIGDARFSPINYQTYRRTTSGAGTTDPSLDTTNWTLATAPNVPAGATIYTALNFGAF